jgi:hypothetical protein
MCPADPNPVLPYLSCYALTPMFVVELAIYSLQVSLRVWCGAVALLGANALMMESWSK